MTERELIERHTVRGNAGRRLFRDGLPEPGTAAYEALTHAQRLRLCEARVGVFRPSGDDTTDAAISTAPPPKYRDAPIDQWKD